MTNEDEIDALYQLPLADFTRERDLLAKRPGVPSADIKALRKPTAAAWAMNQLYWRRRTTFDRLVRASDRRRAAHLARLTGKRSDVEAAEAVYAAALEAALDQARVFLKESGEEVSPVTIAAMRDTLGALPWPDPQGRLTRPLQQVGFGALAGLAGTPREPMRRADVVSIHTGKATTSVETDRARAARAKAKSQEAAETERELSAAKAAEREAEAELSHARQLHERAERDRDHLRVALEKAAVRVRETQAELDRTIERVTRATSERARLDERLAQLRHRP